MPERLLKQLKKLDKVGPSTEWKENTRNFLFNRVKQDTLDYQRSIKDRAQIFSFIWFRRLMPSPVKMMVALVIICLVGATNIAAEAENKPNRLLYDVKLMFEKIPLMMAITSKTEANIYMQYAQKRLEEAKQVSADPSISQQDKQQFISTLVKSAKQNIGAAKDSLDVAKGNGNSAAVAALAKDVTKNAQETIKTLNKMAEDALVNKNVAEARTAIDQAQTASLQVLVDQTATPTDRSVSKDEVKGILADSIAIQEDNLNKLDQKIGQLNPQPKPDLNSTTKIEIKRPEIEAVKKTNNQAKDLLEQAKLLLDKGQLAEALDKVKASAEVSSQSSETVAKIEQLTAGNFKENASTSTLKVIDKKVDNATSTTP
ncbi:MAG: hypothetical protein NTZ18_01280 [Candidatus Komeilibacteria bacterium]|nr:hypothetical protein [Candidatus Komeilibacteria bacterium]